MNWKQEAEHKLRTYAARQHALISLPQQIAALQSDRRGIRAVRADGLAVVGGGSGREAMLVDSISRQQELEDRLAETKIWVSGMDAALEALTEEERLILDRFYIHWVRGNPDRLCEELGLERASVYRRRTQALRKFTLALYGWEEA
jgi:hypothetical protein